MSTTLWIAVCPRRSRTKLLVTPGKSARLKPNRSRQLARSRALATLSGTIELRSGEKAHAVLCADESAATSGTRPSRVLVVVERAQLLHRDAVPDHRRRRERNRLHNLGDVYDERPLVLFEAAL